MLIKKAKNYVFTTKEYNQEYPNAFCFNKSIWIKKLIKYLMSNESTLSTLTKIIDDKELIKRILQKIEDLEKNKLNSILKQGIIDLTNKRREEVEKIVLKYAKRDDAESVVLKYGKCG
jgi:hypothetical protein